MQSGDEESIKPNKNLFKDYLFRLHKKKDWSEDARFKEILTKDSVTQEDIDEELNDDMENHGYSWQRKLLKVLKYTPFQIFCLILVVIDVAVVIAVILIQLEVYKGRYSGALEIYTKVVIFIREKFYLAEELTDIQSIIELTENFTCTEPSSTGDHVPVHSIARRRSISKELRRDKRSESGETTIDESIAVEAMVEAIHFLHMSSIAILAFFTILVFVKIAAEGLKFFKKAMEILDSLIVIISFLLDVLILSAVINPEHADAVIVILLLWQIVRIFNGIMLMEIQRLEMRVKLLKRGKKKLKENVDLCEIEKQNKDKEIESLQNLSRRKGANDDEVALCKPAKVIQKLNAHSGLGVIAQISLNFSMQTPVELEKKVLEGKIKIQRPTDDFVNFMKKTQMFPDKGIFGADVFPVEENDTDGGNNSDDAMNSKKKKVPTATLR